MNFEKKIQCKVILKKKRDRVNIKSVAYYTFLGSYYRFFETYDILSDSYYTFFETNDISWILIGNYLELQIFITYFLRLMTDFQTLITYFSKLTTFTGYYLEIYPSSKRII